MNRTEEERLSRILSYFDETIEIGNRVLELYQKPLADQDLDFLLRFSAERLLTLYFQAVTDIADILINGFVMRDPGSYEDMIEILLDEGAIEETLAEHLKALIRFYKRSSKDYYAITAEEVKSAFAQICSSIQSFSHQVRAFASLELKREFR